MRTSRPYTPEQRIKIYEAAERRISNYKNEFCCHAIEEAAGINEINLRHFPEFRMFKPQNSNYSWFGNDNRYTMKEHRKARACCLLSCAEMIRQGIKTE